MKQKSVGILIFDEVEILDFAGPFEVFSRTRLEGGVESRLSEESAPFRVFTVAASRAPIRSTGDLEIRPAFGFESVEPIDILVVPGGFGTRVLMEDAETLGWIRAVAANAELTTSVCTGALLLARAGLLSGRRATTHHAALDLLASVDPSITVERQQRIVDDGPITSGGVAAGIDMAFSIVEALCGLTVADETARYIEYQRPTVVAHQKGSAGSR